MVTPAAKRKAVVHLCDQHGVSQRRACDVLEIYRSSVWHRSIRPDDTELRKAMKDVAAERRRFGYRRFHIMLERQGIGNASNVVLGAEVNGFVESFVHRPCSPRIGNSNALMG